jgi:hypothetical protein
MENTDIVEATDIPTERHPKAPKFTPFDSMMKLKEKYPNISARNLGKLVGIGKSAVFGMFERHGVDFATGQISDLETFKSNRADILALKQITALRSMTDDKLKKASARDLAVITGILHDHERLERGQATANLDVSLLGLIGQLSERGSLLTAQHGAVIEAEAVVVEAVEQPSSGKLLE